MTKRLACKSAKPCWSAPVTGCLQLWMERAGLSLFCDQPVDGVILDYFMPGMDGGQVAAAMRRHRPEVPILLLSAYINLPPEVIQMVELHGIEGRGTEGASGQSPARCWIASWAAWTGGRSVNLREFNRILRQTLFLPILLLLALAGFAAWQIMRSSAALRAIDHSDELTAQIYRSARS